jgi:hypothetical protein
MFPSVTIYHALLVSDLPCHLSSFLPFELISLSVCYALLISILLLALHSRLHCVALKCIAPLLFLNGNKIYYTTPQSNNNCSIVCKLPSADCNRIVFSNNDEHSTSL